MATIVEPRTDDLPVRRLQRGVVARLARVRRLLRQHLLVEGVFWTATALIGASAATMALDWWLRPTLATRLAVLAIVVLAIMVLLARRLVAPLLLPLEDLDVADLLNRRVPGVGEQIANVLQLPDLIDGQDYASPSMVRAAVAECAQSLDHIDLTATLNRSRRNMLLAGCGAYVLLAVAFCALVPETASLWARRWFAVSTIRWPQATYLNVVGLNDQPALLVPRGELSLVQIDGNPKFTPGDAQNTWRLSGRGETLVVERGESPMSQPPEQVGVVLSMADGATRRGYAAQFDPTNFRYELPPLADPAELNLTGGDDWLGPIVIEPIDRPSVTSLDITAVRPGASEAQTQKVGDASAQYLYLPQTRLELRLVADQPLASAELLDKGTPLEGWTRQDERTYSVSWTMEQSLALEFRLVGTRGGLSSKPYFLTIGLLKDREPRLTIRASGVGRRVTPVARIPLAVRATDDFGVASLGLDLERTELKDDKPQVSSERVDLQAGSPEAAESTSDAQPAEAPPQTDMELDYELPLRKRSLTPGTVLKLRASAADNCALGTQTGNSRTLVFQIVSVDELFYEILMRQREQRAKFNAAVTSAKAQSAALAAVAKPEDVVAVARAHQVISRQVWQIANQLDASLVEMTLNDLGDAAAREIMQSGIITPLRTLHEDLLAQLRTSIDALAQQSTISEERRTQTYELSEQAVKAMETILAQMSRWESFVDVVNQLKQVIQRQGAVLKSTEEIQKKRTDALFEE